MLPELILLFSGKRKSGKDYITDKLREIIGPDSCVIVKISEPIKSHWAKTLGLNLSELLSDSQYKEEYRVNMINWSEEMREKDYGCFCKMACDNARPAKLWVISDIRRRTDIKWFKDTYGSRVKTVKIFADKKTRIKRGWVFTLGVDDVASECDLDGVNEWDFAIDNNDITIDTKQKLANILDIINYTLSNS